MSKRIHNMQEAYNLGYDNPAKSSRDFLWGHLVVVNAYASGQSDAQNHAPRNKSYDHRDYHPETFEKLIEGFDHPHEARDEQE